MDYKITIGVEVHCELKTNNKIFSPSISAYGSMANTNTNVIDLGYPGSLPQLNPEVLEYAIRACKVLNLNITRDMHFDRKNYFYADNPKNFQITQKETPIGTNGYVEIEVPTASIGKSAFGCPEIREPWSNAHGPTIG